MWVDLAETEARFLARVATELASSLDYETTLRNVAHAPLGTLADWCVVDLLEADATLKSAAVAHVDLEQEPRLSELAHNHAPDSTALEGVPRVLRTARAEIVTAESNALVFELHACSGIVAPLLLADKLFGALTIGSDRRLSEADLVLAQDLASRCAQAIHNAFQYQLAREAISLRDTFLATISHDLKNPLATIGGQAQMLRRLSAHAQGVPSERLDRGIQRIETTVQRMARLIDGVLDVTRLELGGRLQLERTRVDLVEVAKQVAAEHQERAPRHRVQVAGESTLIGNWDLARLERVLDNLVGNAVKYSPQGGVVTIVCTRDLEDAEQWAIVSVRDQGLGIPQADLGHIFERFQRASNVGGISGTGIGLAMIRDVINLHGGTIDVDSTEGQGSTFTIRLPVHSLM